MKKSTILKLLLACATFACYQLTFAANTNALKSYNNGVLEVVVFQSKPGVTSKQLTQSAEAITPILKSMPGFESRAIGKGKKAGEWVDIVHWQSMKQALLAAKDIVHYPKMKTFMSLMSGYTIYHFNMVGK